MCAIRNSKENTDDGNGVQQQIPHKLYLDVSRDLGFPIWDLLWNLRFSFKELSSSYNQSIFTEKLEDTPQLHID